LPRQRMAGTHDDAELVRRQAFLLEAFHFRVDADRTDSEVDGALNSASIASRKTISMMDTVVGSCCFRRPSARGTRLATATGVTPSTSGPTLLA
jgi:hypothetical protein